MAFQILGSVTFTQNPGSMTIIRPDRICSYIPTYASVGFFSWGPSIIGKEVLLKWSVMPSGQYEDIHTLWEADAQVLFNPQDGETYGGGQRSYYVEVLDLQGEYCIGVTTSGDRGKRKNIDLKLLIMATTT